MRSSAAVALAIAVFSTPATLPAATRLVSIGGSDSGNCTVTPCATLTYAIGQAVNGDTISVGAGSFNNGGTVVVVDKTLSVRGAQAGVDARTRAAVPESILTEPVQLSANGVALDGFTVTCGTCGLQAGIAVVTSSSFSGYSVVNNIITGNSTGVTFGSSGAMTSTLAVNNIFDNNVVGPSPGQYGIITDTAVTNAVVDRNRFSGHSFAQIDFVRLIGSRATVTISNNLFPLGSTDGPAVVLIGNQGSVVSSNRVTGGGGAFGALFLAGADDDITLSGNSVIGNGASGVLIYDFIGGIFGTPPNGRVFVGGNTLLNNAIGVDILGGNSEPIEVHYNRIAGNTIALRNTNLLAPVNGENNWFGCNGGPSACANNVLMAPADLDPWLVMHISASPAIINLLQTSLVAADLRQNSDGVPIAGFPDGTPIAFGASGGSIAPPASNTFEAAAVATFTPSALGTANARATLDAQTVTANIAVVESIPALSSWMLALLAALLGAIGLVVIRR